MCLLALIPNFFHIMYPKVEKVSLLDTEYFDNFVRLTPINAGHGHTLLITTQGQGCLLMIEVSDDLLFGLHQLAKGQDGNYIIIVWFQKKLGAGDKCSSSPHESQTGQTTLLCSRSPTLFEQWGFSCVSF